MKSLDLVAAAQQERASSTRTILEPSAGALREWLPESHPSSRSTARDGARSVKTQSRHWERLAIVYVRQSSPQQVLEHRESRERQYALVERAVAMGWPRERVHVIDEDQGRSGTTAEGRLGFQQLLVDVNMDRVGLILGLEMSRLARSNRDWHHLLEVCAVFETLLADHDGVYDPTDVNDRLLLGLKGTISEMELHTMHNRLLQGKRHKAERGELFMDVPRGYVRTPTGEIALDPDEEVRSTIQRVFQKFEELKSIHAVLRHLVATGVRLPARLRTRGRQGELEWRRPSQIALRNILRHPMYAGAYCYGRTRVDPRRAKAGRRGSGRQCLPPEEAQVLLHDRVPAYISWEEFQRNQRKLAENRTTYDTRGVPRRGTALLAGLLRCGRCGWGLRVCYTGQRKRPRYVCSSHQSIYGLPACQSLEGDSLDELVTRQVLRALEPAALELSLATGDALEDERRQQSEQWRLRLERACYETQRARRQYDVVEPENRLVARELERRWEQALTAHGELEAQHAEWERGTPARLTADERARIEALARDIPALWHDPQTSSIDRKTIMRALLDRVVVTIDGTTEITNATIHWAGGFQSQHQFRRAVHSYERLANYERLLARVAELRDAGYRRAQIAKQLTDEGFRPAQRHATFSERNVATLVSRARVRKLGAQASEPESAALPAPNEWWASNLASRLGVPLTTLHSWRRQGWIQARKRRGWPDRWIYWANAAELDRLCQLRAHRRGGHEPYPAELTTPTSREDN